MQKPLEGTESKKVEDKKKDFVQNIDKKFRPPSSSFPVKSNFARDLIRDLFGDFYFREKKIGGEKNAKNDEGGCQSIKVIKKSPNEDSSFPENSSHLCARCVGVGVGQMKIREGQNEIRLGEAG